MDDLPPIEIFNAESIEDLIAKLPHRKKYFTLLLLWDVLDESLKNLAEKLDPLVSQGLIYFCSWGNNCELVHDAVDVCRDEGQYELLSSEFVLMTTWHDDEPLEEAFWYFSTLATPTEEVLLNNCERFVVSICNPSWTEEIKNYQRKNAQAE